MPALAKFAHTLWHINTDTINSMEIEFERPKKSHILRWIAVGILGLLLLVFCFGFYRTVFQSRNTDTETERFVIPINMESTTSIAELLMYQGYLTINQSLIFTYILKIQGVSEIKPGGYHLSKSQSPWKIVKILKQEPYMKWVVIPEGLRKEEIAEILTATLGWIVDEKQTWITIDTAPDANHTEGTYFPDTYLIPVDESTSDVAKRMRANFEEKFAPFVKEANAQNIKWTTLLKIASLVQREASDKKDMPLIAGIIWNRLLSDMKLDIDATLQYARGNTGQGFWAPISVADKQKDSPYNTYKYTGLPPRPIANPGTEAIHAVLYPEKTECLYYLHDSSGITHCARTYEEHQKNIKFYLR